MKKFLPSVIFLMFSGIGRPQNIFGQLIQFSQNYFTVERVNPALLGFLESASVKLLHRRQTFLSNDQLSTHYVSLNYTNENKGLGANFSYASDQSTSLSFFRTDEFSFSYATSVKIGHSSRLSLGAGINFSKMSLDLSRFTTSSQFVPGRGFNELIQNGEGNSAFIEKDSRFHTGIAYRKHTKEGIAITDVGISVLNIDYLTHDYNRGSMPAAIIGHAAKKFSVTKNSWLGGELYFNHLYTVNSLMVGTSLHQRVNWYERNRYWHDEIQFTARYHTLGYFSFGTLLRKQALWLGLSYDFYTGDSPINNGFELSAAYEFSAPPVRKRKKRRRKRNRTVIKRRRPPPKGEKYPNVQKPEELKEESPAESSAEPSAGHDIHIKLNRLYLLSFTSGSHDLTEHSVIYLKKLRDELHAYEEYKIVIYGHTDNVGSDEQNYKLSVKRAEAIKKYLIHAEVDPGRIEVIGKGEQEPIAGNETDIGRATNRRVEIQLVKDADP